MATYKVINYVDVSELHENESVMIKQYPSNLASLFGFKEKVLTFHGSGTVWHQFPSGKRAGSLMESLLVDLVTRYKMRQKKGK